MKDEKKPEYNLDRILKVLKDKDSEVLRCLYVEYSQRMRHNGAQIWLIGSVFIPLSLSGIVLGFSDRYRTLALALSSSLLIWLWYFISQRIRTDLDHDLAICAAIETTLLKPERPYTKRGIDESIEVLGKKTGISLRYLRLIIPLAITIAWSLITIWAFLS